VAVSIGRLISRAVQDRLPGGKGLLDVGLADQSVEAADLGAAVEQQQGGDAQHVKPAGCLQVAVDVDADGPYVRVPAQHCGQPKFQSAAGCAGELPEVQQGQSRTAEQLLDLVGGGGQRRAAGAAAASSSPSGACPTLAMAWNSREGRPPMELMKMVVTDSAIAIIAHTG